MTKRRVLNGEEVPDDAPLDVLGRMLDGDPPAPWLAFAALSARSDPAALSLIVRQCESLDPFKRRAAVEALGQNPLGLTMVEYARRALDDPSPAVVDVAIEAIGRLRDEASRPRLLALLKDKNPYYRGYALLALQYLWKDDDFDPVLHLAEADRDERTRRAAALLLRAHPVDPRRLIELWRASELPRERVWACELIAEKGSAGDYALLERLRKDTDGHVRQSAEDALIALERRG